MRSMPPSAEYGYRHALVLVQRAWRSRVPEQRRLLMLAGALNAATWHRYALVAGYLITPEVLYLVLDTQEPDPEPALEVFTAKVREELEDWLEAEQELLRPHPFGPPMTEADWEQLFRRQPLRDRELVDLLVGKKVRPPYDDPHLRRLREILRYSEFSSLVDRSGAVGPVMVEGGDNKSE